METQKMLSDSKQKLLMQSKQIKDKYINVSVLPLDQEEAGHDEFSNNRSDAISREVRASSQDVLQEEDIVEEVGGLSII